MRLFLFSSFLVAMGCGSEPSGVRLGELPAPRLYISASTGSVATGRYHGLGTLRVSISTGSPDCLTMRPDVTATINEMSMGSFKPGGLYYSLDAKGEECNSPRFFVDDNHRAIHPEAASHLPDLTLAISNVVISDGETEWRADFQSVCAARSMTVLSPAMGSVHAGDTVVLRWSPSTDLISPDMLLVRKEGAEEIVHRVHTPTVEGSTVKFTMPTLPAEGRYTFEPRGVSMFQAGVARCEGPGGCEARCTDIKVAPATLDFAL